MPAATMSRSDEKSARKSDPRKSNSQSSDARPEPKILYQSYFKSVGTRTYAAQVKRAKNGNHYLVLMEGKRDESSGDVRKTRLFIYSEDFVEFFRLIKSAAEFIKEHPLPSEVREKRERFWAKQGPCGPLAGGAAAGAAGPRR